MCVGHRRRGPELDLGAHPGQRRRRDGRHGRRRAAGAARARPAAGRRDDVRRHHAVRRRTRASGWRSAATRCSCSTPPAPAGARWRRSSRPASSPACSTSTTHRARATTWSAACCRPAPDRLEAAGRRGRAAGRLARRAGHGQLRRARHRAAAVRGPQPLRAQPDGDADAHDAGGVRRARAADRAQAVRRDGPTALFMPLRGVSLIDAEGQPFHDPEADAALFEALRAGLGADVEVIEIDLHINDAGVRRGDGRQARRVCSRGDDRRRGAREAARRRSTAAA